MDCDGYWTMKAFTHRTYHESGSRYIVCDLQGRYRCNRFNKKKSGFELVDPEICSRNRAFGPTDHFGKRIETFFGNHQCNQFCDVGGRWYRPNGVKKWYPESSATSMFSSAMTCFMPKVFNTLLAHGANVCVPLQLMVGISPSSNG